jgi:hypothetical protein
MKRKISLYNIIIENIIIIAIIIIIFENITLMIKSMRLGINK